MTSVDEGAGATPVPVLGAAPTLDLGAELEGAAAEAARRRRARREAVWRTSARYHPTTCPPPCNAALVWALTESVPPRWIPLTEPGGGLTGNVALVRDGAARIAVVNPPPEVAGPFYRAHFADCPGAARHRRR